MHCIRQLLLGAHVSAAGGSVHALEEGLALGCNVLQFFTANNRQWSFKLIADDQVHEYRTQFKKTSFKVMIHAVYLINLGSSNKDVLVKSKKALLFELGRCEQLRIPYLVMHPGSRINLPETKCLEQIAALLDEVFDEAGGSCHILLENTAGQGTSVGHMFEQLATIRMLSKHKRRLGFCFDTCHAHAAGYCFTDEKGYHAMWNHFDSVLGISHLKAMHLNDSERECGSRVDRHAGIGKGTIGFEAFRLLLNDKRFEMVPKVIETPRESFDDHVRNLAVLRKLVKIC